MQLLYMLADHRVHRDRDETGGVCICPLSWSVHCNFTGDGKCNERGWACTPHLHQPGANVSIMMECDGMYARNAAVATLCVLCVADSLIVQLYNDLHNQGII